MNKYISMAKAYESGYETATALKSGDIFQGAIPESLKHYEKDSLEYSSYISGYLHGIDKRFGDSVPCKIDGDVWRIE